MMVPEMPMELEDMLPEVAPALSTVSMGQHLGAEQDMPDTSQEVFSILPTSPIR